MMSRHTDRQSDVVEVQEDMLRVLDLRRFDNDGERRRDLDRRVDKEFFNISATAG